MWQRIQSVYYKVKKKSPKEQPAIEMVYIVSGTNAVEPMLA